MTDHKKKNLWSKIRTQYDSASAAISQLSLTSSENDGDNEDDTVIHNALVRYYIAKDGITPSWLGGGSAMASASAMMDPRRNSAPSRPANGGLQRTGTSSFMQDIYNRRGSAIPTTGPQHAQHVQHGGIPDRSRSPIHPEDLNRSDRSDRFRTKLKSASVTSLTPPPPTITPPPPSSATNNTGSSWRSRANW